MSVVEQQMHVVCKIVQRSFGRLSSCVRGDLLWIAQSHSLMIADMLIDDYSQPLSVVVAVLGNFARYYSCHGYKALSMFKVADDAFMTSLQADTFTIPEPEGSRRWFAPIRKIVGAEYSSARAWHQIFSYPTRVVVMNDQLEKDAKEKYLMEEARVAALAQGSHCDATLCARAVALAKLFLDPEWRQLDISTQRRAFFEKYGWHPSHGSGTTADAGVSLWTKHRFVGYTPLIRYAMPYDGHPISQPDPCKILFVPKSVTSLRTISCEPATYIWHGGGLQSNLYNVIECNAHFRKHMCLQDATLSSALSRIGSLTHEYATIDLSSASDYVSWELVTRLFSHTWMYAPLCAVRSKQAILDGEVIALAKAYPMGSRLCFVVMSLVFLAVIESAIIDSGHTLATTEYRVYGDDLVVPQFAYDRVIERLQALGFKVNTLKTFEGRSRFREACGGEWLDGQSIRPLRLGRSSWYFDTEMRGRLLSAPEAAQLTELCNSAFDYGYSRLRLFTIRTLERFNVDLWYGEDPGAVRCCYANNRHLRHRHSAAWQTTLYNVSAPSHMPDDLTDYDPKNHLDMWLAAADGSPKRSDPLVIRQHRKCIAALDKTWVAPQG